MDGINSNIVNNASLSLELVKNSDAIRNNSKPPKSTNKNPETETSKEISNESKQNKFVENDINLSQKPEIKPSKENNKTKVENIELESSKVDVKEEIKNEDTSNKKDSLNSKEGKTVLNDGTVLYFRLEESKNEETGAVNKELIVYLVDKESGDIVRRVPPEEFSERFSKKIDEVGGYGVFVNQIG